MTKGNETFGERVRQRREEKKISLRKFAEMVDVSPTYISQIERGEFSPPKEEKIRLMAQILGENEDELLSLANKVSSDLPAIIQKHPKEVATFLRTASNLSPEQWKKLTKDIEKQTGKGKHDD
ncbi:MAG: helix-turn-helix domain-containing protein [Alphaproteobacteria bacterium]|nr:helix-turn-helix domain-containing protein [Alphaproteobacteria bacterium]